MLTPIPNENKLSCARSQLGREDSSQWEPREYLISICVIGNTIVCEYEENFCVTPLGNVNTRVILCKSNLITAHPDDTHTARAERTCRRYIVSNLKFPCELVTGKSRIPPRGSAIRSRSGNYFLFGSISPQRPRDEGANYDHRFSGRILLTTMLLTDAYFASENLTATTKRSRVVDRAICTFLIRVMTVNVRLGSPILRVLLRSMLPDVFVTAVAYEHDHHDHTADHGAKSEPI
ncbi:Uncharacterized protein DBV15_00636 [Temnothorax longispinosus]|uniref:Uncharacterized protein n=1 Tax=Temnothorax longispinosus TaxID=300112 RepID=A0A4S2KXY9_9HYME|nr:Uncharacterized protein DBV15_00636 [Temnothorax longispinosus]